MPVSSSKPTFLLCLAGLFLGGCVGESDHSDAKGSIVLRTAAEARVADYGSAGTAMQATVLRVNARMDSKACSAGMPQAGRFAGGAYPYQNELPDPLNFEDQSIARYLRQVNNLECVAVSVLRTTWKTDPNNENNLSRAVQAVSDLLTGRVLLKAGCQAGDGLQTTFIHGSYSYQLSAIGRGEYTRDEAARFPEYLRFRCIRAGTLAATAYVSSKAEWQLYWDTTGELRGFYPH